STAHVLEQPSPDAPLPSSQRSSGPSHPSPHAASSQVFVHVSVLTSLPSSHSSPSCTLPSEQVGSAQAAPEVVSTQAPAHVFSSAVVRSGPQVTSASSRQKASSGSRSPHSSNTASHVPVCLSQFSPDEQRPFGAQNPMLQTSSCC